MGKFSTARAAQILDISTTTLKRWYKWYEDETWEKPVGLKLPQYTVDSKGTRYFTMEAVQELQEFYKELQKGGKYYGCMAEFNAYYQWGRRGTHILERKASKNEQNENS